MEDTDHMTYASSIPRDVIDRVRKDQEQFYHEAVREAKAKMEEKGIKVKAVVAKGYPVDVICDTAEKEDINLIVLGRRRLGKIESSLLGSVSNKVVQSAKTNVMIIKH